MNSSLAAVQRRFCADSLVCKVARLTRRSTPHYRGSARGRRLEMEACVVCRDSRRMSWARSTGVSCSDLYHSTRRQMVAVLTLVRQAIFTSLYQQLLAKVSALPGVESTAVISGLPLRGSARYSFSILGKPAPPPNRRPDAGFVEVSADFLRILRIPLRKGRYLDVHDNQTAPWTVVINEAFAHRYFPRPPSAPSAGRMPFQFRGSSRDVLRA